MSIMRHRDPHDDPPAKRHPERYQGPPMTLANMRAQGVRSLSVSYWHCHHGAALIVDRWPDDVPLPSFGPRMVCTGCGIVGADVRPNWQEREGRESLTGAQWR
jgi:hypothetical protein